MSAFAPSRSRVVAVLCLLLASGAGADTARLRVSGGVSTIEGSGGGGLVPWALVTGHAGRGEIGAGAFASRARVDDLELDVFGAAVTAGDRLEVSVARQALHVDPLDLDLRQDVFGAKLRLFGRVPYETRPQVAVGVQWGRNRDFDGVPAALGAEDDAGLDVYVAASKLFFAALAGRNVFTNLTVRSTRAHETGLVGFGDDREIVLEGSAGVFLTDRLVLGAEYRHKPKGLPGIGEEDWSDLFVAWFPLRNLSVTAARLDLGDVVVFEAQTGWYLSLEASL